MTRARESGSLDPGPRAGGQSLGPDRAESEEYRDWPGSVREWRECECRALGNMNMANGSPDGDMAQLLIICGSRGLMGNDYKYV
jgi:hypothetical protein